MAVAVAILAWLGSIFLLVRATDLESSAAMWVVWAAVFHRALAQRRSDPGYAWLAASFVAATTWQVISAWAQHRGWPPSQLSLLAVIGDWLRPGLLAVVVLSIVIGIRSGSLTWPPWRSADKDIAGPG